MKKVDIVLRFQTVFTAPGQAIKFFGGENFGYNLINGNDAIQDLFSNTVTAFDATINTNGNGLMESPLSLNPSSRPIAVTFQNAKALWQESILSRFLVSNVLHIDKVGVLSFQDNNSTASTENNDIGLTPYDMFQFKCGFFNLITNRIKLNPVNNAIANQYAGDNKTYFEAKVNWFHEQQDFMVLPYPNLLSQRTVLNVEFHVDAILSYPELYSKKIINK